MTFLKSIITASLIAATIFLACFEHWTLAALAFAATAFALIWHLKDDHNG